MLPTGVSLKNAFRARKWVGNEDQAPLPQSFTFMARAGQVVCCIHFVKECYTALSYPLCMCSYLLLPLCYPHVLLRGLPDQGQSLELSDRVPRALRADNVMDDVFCMVKAKMAGDGLSQSPLLVLPGNFLEQSKRLLKRANETNCPLQTCHLEQDRREELRLLKGAISKDFPFLTRTQQFYESMIAAAPCTGKVPKLSFLNRANTDGRRDWGAMGLGQRPKTPKPHELQVVFHRARV